MNISQVKILSSDQIGMTEQANFTYFALRKALEKQTKRIEDQGRRQTDIIMNQNKTQKSLINNGGKTLFPEQIFKKFFKKEFDKIIKLTDETNFYDSICYFKDDSSRKRCDGCENGIEIFE